MGRRHDSHDVMQMVYCFLLSMRGGTVLEVVGGSVGAEAYDAEHLGRGREAVQL